MEMNTRENDWPKSSSTSKPIIWDIIYTYYNRKDKTMWVWETPNEAIDNAKYSPETFAIYYNRPFPLE